MAHLAQPGIEAALALIYPEPAHPIRVAARLEHAVKMVREYAVQQQIHNSLFPREQVDGAMFAIEIIVQRNTWAKLECATHQLLV